MMKQKPRTHSFRKSSSKAKALTFIEMIITVSIFSFIGIFLIYISIEVAQRFRQSITQVPALEQSIRSLSFIRTQLLPAQWQTIQISNNNRTITFVNPNEGTTSTVTFDATTRNVIYRPDITSATTRNWGRSLTGSFTRLADNRSMQINITSTAVGRNNNPLTYNFSELEISAKPL